MITLTLPYPPSANRMWRRSGTRIHKSSEYQRWLTLAGWEIVRQDQRKIGGPYWLEIDAVKPDKRRRDLDNLKKPISDLLVAAGVVDDDCHAQKITIQWVPKGPPIVARLWHA